MKTPLAQLRPPADVLLRQRERARKLPNS
jgi:hypothetical protein